MKCIGLTLILKAQGTDLRQREMPMAQEPDLTNHAEENDSRNDLSPAGGDVSRKIGQ